MALIPLTNGGHAIVNDEDAAILRGFRWTLIVCSKREYAITRMRSADGLGRKSVYMHRFLTEAPSGKSVDHKNGDGLDNRRENLRICTQSQNNGNSRWRLGASGYRGVYRHANGLYYARITRDFKDKTLGCSKFAAKAAKLYDAAALEHFGEFATLNFPLCAMPQVAPRPITTPAQSGTATTG